MAHDVAALFVLPDGPYANRPDVDAWSEARDARLYAGPLPVVAHPPCARWGRFAWHGEIGADDGCFASALKSVNAHGGVLEHPQASRAWPAFGLATPTRGKWSPSGEGWVTEVDQGVYGHRLRKRTWLYFRSLTGDLPPFDLDWSEGRMAPELEKRPGRRGVGFELLCKRERELTPPSFAEALIELALASAWQEAT